MPTTPALRRGAADGHLAKRGVVAIPFADVAELMIVTLRDEGTARRQHIAAADQRLTDRSGIDPPRAEPSTSTRIGWSSMRLVGARR